MPLDADGVPTLTADLSEAQTIRDTLHNVDRILVSNQTVIKDAMLSFETYTSTLAGSDEVIDAIMRKATGAFDGVNSALAKVDNVLPGISRGNDSELFQKVKSIRELAESFNKRSGVLMEEGRRTLLDISEAASRSPANSTRRPSVATAQRRHESRSRGGNRVTSGRRWVQWLI